MTKALKPVLKRPWQHHVIILCYVAAPFCQHYLGEGIPSCPPRHIRSSSTGYGVSPRCGSWHRAPRRNCALLHKPVAWYLFLGHSSLILLDYISNGP